MLRHYRLSNIEFVYGLDCDGIQGFAILYQNPLTIKTEEDVKERVWELRSGFKIYSGAYPASYDLDSGNIYLRGLTSTGHSNFVTSHYDIPTILQEWDKRVSDGDFGYGVKGEKAQRNTILD
jgi:hypothetical protein